MLMTKLRQGEDIATTAEGRLAPSTTTTRSSGLPDLGPGRTSTGKDDDDVAAAEADTMATELPSTATPSPLRKMKYANYT